jgi:hypothetical protein
MSTEYSNEFNTLLGGEISAVETYDLAMNKSFAGKTLECLSACRASHAKQVQRLTEMVIETGGTPSTGSGPWGAFAAMVQNSASSDHDALALLEQFEAERLVQYESQREIAPPQVNSILVSELLPAQHESHLVVSALLKDATPLPNA